MKGFINYDLGRNATIVIELAVGLAVGMAAQTARHAHAELERAARLSASLEERERLSRQVHDGAIQVLALVSRRGREIGGETAELAELAGEQERALRRLVSSADAEPRRRSDRPRCAAAAPGIRPGVGEPAGRPGVWTPTWQANCSPRRSTRWTTSQHTPAGRACLRAARGPRRLGDAQHPRRRGRHRTGQARGGGRRRPRRCRQIDFGTLNWLGGSAKLNTGPDWKSLGFKPIEKLRVKARESRTCQPRA